ncbi:hypothetical protein [Nocardia arthritidis]|uniref:DUF8020 domain-containing protein n=1 Tax=Nocardia arthritidis TaxID=228602 RepID=A0A6G9Y4V3_9NOCA|nr:hypothetical protein [Nocardia arthritidis]QIS08130.1 hypothetical protein F5544_00990 [Nocardia arthritidis]
MLMRKFAATSALVIAALGVTAGTVNAQPAEQVGVSVAQSPDNANATVIKTDSGSIDVEDGVLKIKAADGTVMAGTPLTFRVNDFEFPIAANVADKSVTLTPQYDMDHATYKPVALPYEDVAPWKTPYDREQAAWNRMKDEISLAATVATVVGTIGGATVGCVLGGIVGATVAAATIAGLFGPFIPAALVGCIGGAATAAPLGGIATNILITAPVAIAAAVQYFTTINAPFTPAPSK